MRRLLRGRNVCAIALFGIALAGCRSTSGAGARPEPGTEYYAVAPESIREVVFSSPERKLYAYRWNGSATFQIFTASPGTAPEQCAAGDGFGRWLAAIATIPVRSVADSTVAGAWAEVRLRDATDLDANEATLLVPASPSDPVLMRVGEQSFVVGIDAALLRSVNAGCAGLGRAR
jgi:hypothetical protein